MLADQTPPNPFLLSPLLQGALCQGILGNLVAKGVAIASAIGMEKSEGVKMAAQAVGRTGKHCFCYFLFFFCSFLFLKCVCVCVCVCVYVSMYVCVCGCIVCMYVCACICV